LSAIQRSLDWWWERHPYLLIFSTIFLAAIAQSVFETFVGDALAALLQPYFLELVFSWFYQLNFFTVVGLGICAFSGLCMKVPGE
jgi:hypothetical protein